MKTKSFVLCLILSFGSLSSQNVGDEATAGFDGRRTGQNAQAGNFGTPFVRVRQVGLTGVADAASMTAFRRSVVIGEGSNGIRYSVFDLSGPDDLPSPSVTTTFGGVDSQFDFSPSFSQDILLLGGSSTTTLKALRVSNGVELWQDTQIGQSRARDPLLSGNLAVYAGAAGVTAARADTGIVLWQSPATTAAAPLAMQGDRVYFVDDQGTLNALDLLTGAFLFGVPGAGSNGSSIVAGDDLIFLTRPDIGIAQAVRTADQTVAWAVDAQAPASDGGLILAGDRLFVLAGRGADSDSPARISAVVPETGEMIWQADEDTPGVDHAFAANGLLVYYSSGSQEIRVRDAATGVLVFSLPRPDLRDMTFSDGRLLVLLPTQLEIFERRSTLFFAQTADGMGQSTLLALINPTAQSATAQVEFFDASGSPMSLPVEGQGDVSSLQLVIGPGAAGRVQTQSGDVLQAGWTRVTSDQELRGTALFQFTGDSGRFEAGIGQSNLTGQASLFVLRANGDALSTAVAAANPSQSDAEMTLTLLDALGAEAFTMQTPLAAGTQFALFVEELFPDVGDDFQGTLRISSNVPIVLTSLRTQDGLQLSSLPAGQIR